MKNQLTKILKNLAKKVIAKNKNLEIIGVTGSVGKSSTKEAIYQVLKVKYANKIEKSEGNLNTEIGLPLVILGFKKNPAKVMWPIALLQCYWRAYYGNPLSNLSILVLEYAADKPGDIKYLTEIVRPNVAVITKIGSAHTQFFGTVLGVAKEKGYLAEALSKNGTLFLNKDDSYSKDIAKRTKAKIKYFSDDFEMPKNIAQIVAEHYGLTKIEIENGLAKIKPLPGRLNIFKGIRNTTIIDDTYNANPESMTKALKYLNNLRKGKNKIAIVGDMRELGELSKIKHQTIAKEISKDANLAILIGPEMEKWAHPILENIHFPHYTFKNFTNARQSILKSIKGDEVILVKASQNTLFLERAVEMLLLNKEDKEKLCRRGKFWENLRKNTL